MKLKKTLSLYVITIMVIAAALSTGCETPAGGTETFVETPAGGIETFVGVWRQEKMGDPRYYLYLEKGGALYVAEGEPSKLNKIGETTYTVNGKNITIKDIPYSFLCKGGGAFEGNKLTLRLEGYTMVFSRVDSPTGEQVKNAQEPKKTSKP